MRFDNIDEILEILLFSDKSYTEIEDYCEKLFPAIKVLHKNSLGNKYPSKYTQCILECFKLKNNYNSTTWYSNKLVNNSLINIDSKPIEFNRINSKGEICKYVLYNEDLINKLNNTKENFSEIKKQRKIKKQRNNTKENFSEIKKQQNNIIVYNCLNNVDIEAFKKLKLRYFLLKAMKFDTVTKAARDIDFFIERFGLVSGKSLTLEEIGILHTLSRERIRQIIERTFKKFKYKLLNASIENSPNIFELARYLAKVTEYLDSLEDKSIKELALKQFIRKEFGNYSSLYIKLLNKLTNKNYPLYSPKFTTMNNGKILRNKTSLSNENKNNSKIKCAILACINEFCGKYGKSGIAKILKGRKLKENAYNKAATNSSYYGMFEQLTLSFIEKRIDDLIDEDYIEIKKYRYGLPLLLTNPKAKKYILENIKSP